MKYCNKAKKLVLSVLITAAFLGWQAVKAETKKEVTDWNSPSLSFFCNEQSKADLMNLLPEWDIQPMTWPTEEEIENCRGTATEAQKKECVKGIKEYLKDEWIPDEITSHLLPLRKWAKVSEDWKEKGKADVFLCRYCIDNYLIQIMDGNWTIIITIKEISDTPPLKKPDQKDFVSKISKTFWKGGPLEMPLAQQQPKNMTKGGVRFGKMGWNFITDGKLIKYELTKMFPGYIAGGFPDPYQPRFSSAKKSK